MILSKIQDFKNDLLLIASEKKIENCTNFELKISPEKWSKKEELGHLVDSARYNLQRFTEVLFAEERYQFKPYNQNLLVIVNSYQSKDNQELINLFIELNKQLLFVLENYTLLDFQRKVIIPSGEIVTLEFWVQDYIEHFFHHINKIIS